MANASFTLYILLLVLSSLWLTYLVPEANFEAVLFEAISAFSTVGLTMGLTYELSDIGKLLLTAIMFVGRIGLLSLGAIIFIKHRNLKPFKTQDISI